MADTPRTQAYLLGTEFPDGQIKSISAQYLRDFVVSISGSTLPGAFTSLAANSLVNFTYPDASPKLTWSGSNATAFSQFQIYQVPQGTVSVNPFLNSFNIGQDKVNVSTASGQSIGFNFNHVYGGGTGGKVAIAGLLTSVATTGTYATNGGNPNFVCGLFSTHAKHNEGGTTNLFPGLSKGTVYGTNPIAWLSNTATNFVLCCGEEIDVLVSTGASCQQKTGLNLVKISGDAVQGGNGYDTAIQISDQNGVTASWDYGILLGHNGSQWPFYATSTLIGAQEAQNDKLCTAAYGVDFRQATFVQAAFTSVGFKVDPSGNLTAGAGTLNLRNFTLGTTADGLVVDAGTRQTALTAAIAAGGSGWAAGDKFTTAYGGVYKVATISGSAAATITQLVPDVSASPPGNPVATTASNANLFRTGGTGLTLNLTWTASNTLSLNPSGGPIVATGLQGSTTYADDAAAALGGVDVGQLYRNGSVVQIRIS